MKRKIIVIDEEKCVGCGLCANACQEGAIGMVDGKAKLLREDHCDGLGNCLPVCPTGAISFEERQAAAFDGEVVKQSKSESTPPAGGCPGSRAQSIPRAVVAQSRADEPVQSELRQWPVQIKLVPTKAPYFDGAHLLIAADCAAYAHANFHRDFMFNKITIIGCPKLDEGSYADKLTEILRQNNMKSVTIARMEVPCCGGLAAAAKQALQDCGKLIAWGEVIITTDGQILED